MDGLDAHTAAASPRPNKEGRAHTTAASPHTAAASPRTANGAGRQGHGASPTVMGDDVGGV